MPRTRVDYATDNITVYREPCYYNCRYCWAWRLPVFKYRIQQGKYDPVEEARRYLRKKGRTIVVSFTSDPYPPYEVKRRLTRRVLEVLAKNPNNRVLVLTKNPIIALAKDKDLFTKYKHIWLGTTVICLNSCRDLEPNAPSTTSRLKMLEWAHSRGIRTWLSIEPIIPKVTYPEWIIQRTLDYVDWYVLGAFNYPKQLGFNLTRDELKKWYREHVDKTIEILLDHNKKFFIKKELWNYLGGVIGWGVPRIVRKLTTSILDGLPVVLATVENDED